MMSTKQVREVVSNVADTLSVRQGVFTVKKSYYWGVTQGGSALADKIKSLLPEAFILDYGNHYHGFVGGAKSGSSKDSYFWVKFRA